MKALPYGRNIKTVPGGVHLGRRPSLLCWDVSRHLELMRRYHSLPQPTGLVSLCRDHLIFFFSFFFLSNTEFDCFNCLHLRLEVCFSRESDWCITKTQISLQNNKGRRLIATAPVTEQKLFLSKYVSNDWVSSFSACICIYALVCVHARL